MNFDVFTRRLDGAKWSVFQAEFWSWFNVVDRRKTALAIATTKVDSVASSVAADDDDDKKETIFRISSVSLAEP